MPPTLCEAFPSLTLAACLALGCSSSARTVGAGRGATAPAVLLVTAAEPPPGVIETGPERVLRFRFSSALDPSSLQYIVAASALDLATLEVVSGGVSLEDGGTVLVYRPAPALRADRQYQVNLSPAIRGRDGEELDLEGSGALSFPVTYATFVVAPRLRGPIEANVKSTSAIEVYWAGVEVEDNTALEGKRVEIFAQPASGPLDVSMPAGEEALGARQELLTDLPSGTVFSIALRVLDELGNPSNLSEKLTVSTLDEIDATPPVFGGIQALEAVSFDRPQVLRARWEAALDDRDPPELLRYLAFVSMEAGAQDFDIPAKVSEPGATEMEIDDLPPDTAFFVVIRAADTSGNQDANTLEAVASTPASFRENVFPIFTRSDLGACTSPNCHSASFPRGGLNLTTYQGLLRGGNTRTPRTIVPGDGRGSFLLWRTDASNPNFVRNRSRMPLGRPALPAPLLRTIERWIDQGALDN